MGPAALTAAACLFHGFSDPSRLAIVQHLALGEHRVVELTRHLGLAQRKGVGDQKVRGAALQHDRRSDVRRHAVYRLKQRNSGTEAQTLTP